SKPFAFSLVDFKLHVPDSCAKAPQKLESIWLNLIAGFGTVCRPVWFIRIRDSQPGSYELMHGITAYSLTGVWRIRFSIMVTTPVHNRCYAHERRLGLFPSLLWG